jgi:hypothetical protein
MTTPRHATPRHARTKQSGARTVSAAFPFRSSPTSQQAMSWDDDRPTDRLTVVTVDLVAAGCERDAGMQAGAGEGPTVTI